jgi:hypothetical protein
MIESGLYAIRFHGVLRQIGEEAEPIPAIDSPHQQVNEQNRSEIEGKSK